jgi:hypothetical protein
MFRAILLFRPAVAVALAAVAIPRSFSDPLAVYAVIDRVVLAPDSENPTTIQIFGRFALSERKPGDHYLPTTKGYLLYKLPSGNDRQVRAEWKDLAAATAEKKAGSDNVTLIGFGSKYARNGAGRVRCATEAASNPDEYPFEGSLGVARIGTQRNTGWETAKSLLTPASAVDACTGRK